jgi:putative glutamine amidotransferase
VARRDVIPTRGTVVPSLTHPALELFEAAVGLGFAIRARLGAAEGVDLGRRIGSKLLIEIAHRRVHGIDGGRADRSSGRNASHRALECLGHLGHLPFDERELGFLDPNLLGQDRNPIRVHFFVLRGDTDRFGIVDPFRESLTASDGIEFLLLGREASARTREAAAKILDAGLRLHEGLLHRAQNRAALLRLNPATEQILKRLTEVLEHDTARRRGPGGASRDGGRRGARRRRQRRFRIQVPTSRTQPRKRRQHRPVPEHPPALVAVTATTKIIEEMSRVRLNEAYVRALEGAGLVPMVVPPLDPRLASAVLDGVAGLVLTGGEDVDPACFGAEPHPDLGPVHAARDRFELALVLEARARRMPVLAICRGVQLLNVALGGTLVQDIPSQWPSELAHDLSAQRAERVHAISIDAGSKLARTLGDAEITANSSHHQSIERLGDGLEIVARSPDGIVEGVETADDWWVLGVQWHPEELIGTAEDWDRRLFSAFAEAVSSPTSSSRGPSPGA